MIRVLIADDQALLREGLSTLLKLEQGIQVIGTAVDGEDAYLQALEKRPDVVLMDIRMPGTDGVEGTRKIKQAMTDVKVLILSTFYDNDLLMRALEEGASGYLLKEMPSEAIASGIRTVHSGGVVLQPSISEQLMDALKKMKEKSLDRDADRRKELERVNELTEREIEVLRLLGLGNTNKEIAGALFITEGTVKLHVSNLMAKMKFRDRTHAAIFAVRCGIMDK
ncbi:response regulator [Paenibacillus sedimenti]|uniref:Response regulator transcription factor n=1 Tax=Paenibacillus sedimenti TaxID=2770274 RepID=A0A926KP86_9BACL|nr:response regulator transcription factor [Paenibacillus sedimenti]MBD0381375.1 response regulator transcription factor [Paenibacillus sedimenti]